MSLALPFECIWRRRQPCLVLPTSLPWGMIVSDTRAFSSGGFLFFLRIFLLLRSFDIVLFVFCCSFSFYILKFFLFQKKKRKEYPFSLRLPTTNCPNSLRTASYSIYGPVSLTCTHHFLYSVYTFSFNPQTSLNSEGSPFTWTFFPLRIRVGWSEPRSDPLSTGNFVRRSNHLNYHLAVPSTLTLPAPITWTTTLAVRSTLTQLNSPQAPTPK